MSGRVHVAPQDSPLSRLRKGDLDQGPHCNRLWCTAVWMSWSRDQRRVVREALKAASPIVVLTDVTLPCAGPTKAGRVRGRRNYLPWVDKAARRVELIITLQDAFLLLRDEHQGASVASD
jgi:hypothetical protein